MSDRVDGVWLRARGGTPIGLALAAVWTEMFGPEWMGHNGGREEAGGSSGSDVGRLHYEGAIEAGVREDPTGPDDGACPPPLIHARCGGEWRVRGKTLRCEGCGLSLATLAALGAEDPATYDRLVDPDGAQRAFIAATAIEPRRE